MLKCKWTFPLLYPLMVTGSTLEVAIKVYPKTISIGISLSLAFSWAIDLWGLRLLVVLGATVRARSNNLPYTYGGEQHDDLEAERYIHWTVKWQWGGIWTFQLYELFKTKQQMKFQTWNTPVAARSYQSMPAQESRHPVRQVCSQR
ncbi:uncharacterized protein MELLADRAFT_106206 [Melampsora larici-populina 98AG31]|uniref:Uncharacterized protein n=1 Tax=Melampsora larici-populina (strain 98AG31 / pathotype 3-4-7) TaxID=747676 RepID=F4RLE8_MELLP|nr:uncharacterized protein MELLADRAFT_106206 [Melampsora larici-populina 98AG31]EGG07010.1 hypothetical protein MELLADRAFT_106206 [Melampsora larici-populina 98AG31]